MRIGELARLSGLSTHARRYHERIGLLPFAVRTRAKQRDDDPAILAWIEVLGRLKATGLPIREMLHHARLRAAGSGRAGERQAILCAHRDRMHAHLAEQQACLRVLPSKIPGHGGLDAAEIDDADPSGGRPLHARRTGAG